MARKRDPARDEAKRMWLESGKTMQLKDIAAQLGKSPDQIRHWKAKDSWGANPKKAPPQKSQSKDHMTNGQRSRDYSNEHDLSPQQEIFAQLVAGQRIPMYRAYQIAYKDSKPTLVTAMSSGPKLAKRENVAARINQISKEVAVKHEWSLDNAVESLKFLHDQAKADLIQNGVRKASADALLESAQELNKLLQVDSSNTASGDWKKALMEATKKRSETNGH